MSEKDKSTKTGQASAPESEASSQGSQIDKGQSELDFFSNKPSVSIAPIKKILLAIALVVVLFLVAGYSLFFTSGGNRLLKSYLQTKISQNYPDIKLQKLRMTPTRLDLLAEYLQLQIHIFGNFNLLNQKVKLKIEAKTRSWRYPFSIDGEIGGRMKHLLIGLHSNIARSQTSLIAEVHKYHLERLFVDSKSITLEELLPLWIENNPFSGVANLSFYSDAKTDGQFQVEVQNLYSQRKVSHFALLDWMLKNSASGSIHGKLKGHNIVEGSGSVASKSYRIDFSGIVGDFSKIQWDYALQIPSLKSFNPTIRADFPLEMAGRVNLDSTRHFSFSSQSLGGEIEGRIDGVQANINFNGVNLTRILGLLYISQKVDANFSGNLEYNLNQRAGSLNTEVSSLKIQHNKFFNLVRRYSNFDIQKEEFASFPFILNLRDSVGVAKFTIQGKKLSFASNHFELNFYDMTMAAPLDMGMQLDGNRRVTLSLQLRGNASAPDIVFDLRHLLQFDGNPFKKLQKSLF